MTLKELLDIAKSQLKDLTPVQNPDFRLEQAEYNEEAKFWEIIVSYLVENINKRINPLIAITSDFQFYRIYKRVRINDNGKLIGVYMYNNKE